MNPSIALLTSNGALTAKDKQLIKSFKLKNGWNAWQMMRKSTWEHLERRHRVRKFAKTSSTDW